MWLDIKVKAVLDTSDRVDQDHLVKLNIKTEPGK